MRKHDGVEDPSVLADPVRLETLRRLGVADSEPEGVFDRAVALASRVLGVPVSLLSFVDAERQHFKAAVGHGGEEPRHTPLTHSFCQHVVTSDEVLRVEDARRDPRVKDNPAIQDNAVIAYLGVPVHDPNGLPLGSLCAIAPEPRAWSENDLANLRDIASGVESELRARAALDVVERERSRNRAILDELPIGVAVAEVPSAALQWMNSWGADMLVDDVDAEEAKDYRALGAQHPDGSRYRARDYPLVRSAQSNETIVAEPLIYRRNDGTLIELEVSSRRLSAIAPNEPQLAVATFVDVTERKRAEAEAEASNQRLGRVLEATVDPILATGPNHIITFANHGALNLTGSEDIVGRNIWTVFPDWTGSTIWHAWSDAARTRKPVEVEIDMPRFGASYQARIYPGDDEITAYFRDVTAERRITEQRQLLVRELNHRVKNLFSVVSGMIAMTARASRTPTDMAAALRGRIAALARAHELIRPAVTLENLTQPDVSMQNLVASVIEPHLLHRGDEITIGGPAITLGATSATNLALVLHELATNAAKYGALSAPTGHLRVSWTLQNAVLTLTWTEEGGPPIKEAPAVAGFGSTLIDLSVERQLRGSITRDYRPEGLRATVTMPVAQLQL